MTIENINLKNDKENVILLGDGFFARGFLHNINHNKFNIIQIYRDRFINPHDIMYSLQRNKPYNGAFHFRDLFHKGADIKIQEDIKHLQINNEKNSVRINEKDFNYNYLVIGLGAQKTLKNWSDEINSFVIRKDIYKDDLQPYSSNNIENIVLNSPLIYNPINNIKPMKIGIVGMGPIGFELANVLSKYHKIDMFDMLPETKVLNYVSQERKPQLLNMLKYRNYNISTTYEKMYNPKEWDHTKSIYCVGTRPNILTSYLSTNNYLQVPSTNIYIGGDCSNYSTIKTGQMAYQQGVYVAKRLNGTITSESFEYKHNGMSLNLGYKDVLIEDHHIIPNGIYPDIVIKLYSLFFV